MTYKSQIRLDAIERAHRALEALPPHEPEDLTKTQAIRRLLGPIRASQSKGYSLAAIGKVLAECGIPLSTGALRAFVSDASGAGGKKKRRPAKLGADATRQAAASTSTGDQKAAAARITVPSGKLSGASLPQNVDLDWEPTVPSSKRAAVSGGLDVHQDLGDLSAPASGDGARRASSSSRGCGAIEVAPLPCCTR